MNSSSPGQRRLAGFDDGDDCDGPPAGDPPGSPPASASTQRREPGAAPSPPPPAAGARGRPAYIIDSHSLLYQLFHVMPVDMLSPSGQPVGTIHGFVRDMLDLWEKKHPEYLFCAFDCHGPTFRHELSETYKANREEMPVDLSSQIEGVRRMLAALGIPILEKPGYEADDVLATFARRVTEQRGECVLVTGDKDCRQLLSDRVRMFNLRKNQFFDAAALREDWGIAPEQVVDFQCLVGDSVDNVKGVPLIGPKIARELLTKYGTLEGIAAHTGEISGTKRRENLIEHLPRVIAARPLVRLDDQAPVEFDLEQGRGLRIDLEAALALCREFGFRQIADRIRRLADSSPQEAKPQQAKPPQLAAARASLSGGGPPAAADALETEAEPSDESFAGESFAGESLAGEEAEGQAGAEAITAPLDATPWDGDYQTVTSLDQLAALVAEMSRQEWIAIDTETTSACPRWAELVGCSFAWSSPRAWYVPVRAPAGEVQLDERAVIDLLRPVLENPQVKKIGQNLKYEMVVFRSLGVNLAGAGFDTMVADYLLEPGQRTHGLDELSARYLRHRAIPISSLIGTGKKQKTMDQVPVPQITQYAAEDADVPLRLHALLERRLNEEKLEGLFRDVEMPLVEVLAEMEFNGIRVDPQRLAELSSKHALLLDELEQAIYLLAGKQFNIDSRPQLARILFEDLGLPVIKRTKSGPSTDVEVLESLAMRHELPATIIRYRQSSKLKSTYLDALAGLVCPKTGRVHTSFKQDVAATGRLSSKDPNLQNIPVRTAEGRDVRSAFLPGPPGWKLLTADYSQIELRVLAHYSADQELVSAFAEDRDIHTQVASEVYGTPLEQVTREMRSSAKAINFGIIYGQSAFGLAKALDIDKRQAADFIAAYFQRFPGVGRFIEETLDAARETGCVTTILGRRRTVQGVRPREQRLASPQRNMQERIAVNTVIQGSAADLIKLAMIRVHRRLKASGLSARLLLQIHDELVFEAPAAELEALAELARQEMTAAGQLRTPLKVDIKTGDNWAQCEPM